MAVTIAKAKTDLYRLITEVSESHKPITIIGKNSNAILLAEDDWLVIQAMLNLPSTSALKN